MDIIANFNDVTSEMRQLLNRELPALKLPDQIKLFSFTAGTLRTPYFVYDTVWLMLTGYSGVSFRLYVSL